MAQSLLAHTQDAARRYLNLHASSLGTDLQPWESDEIPRTLAFLSKNWGNNSKYWLNRDFYEEKQEADTGLRGRWFDINTP